MNALRRSSLVHPTRSSDECRALADRQQGGESLGFSPAFVAEWASGKTKRSAPKSSESKPAQATKSGKNAPQASAKSASKAKAPNKVDASSEKPAAKASKAKSKAKTAAK